MSERDNLYLALFGERMNIVSFSAVAGYCKALEDSKIFGKLCGPHSHALQTSFYDSWEDSNLFRNYYFGDDFDLWNICAQKINEKKQKHDEDRKKILEERGVDIDMDSHPRIPPANIGLQSICVLRARVLDETGYKTNHKSFLKINFPNLDIVEYKTIFDDNSFEGSFWKGL